MAALTASSSKRYSTGDTNELEFKFASVNDGDTFTIANLKGYISHIAFCTDNPTTQASAGIHVSEPSSGVFTFYPGEDGAAVILRIKVRS